MAFRTLNLVWDADVRSSLRIRPSKTSKYVLVAPNGLYKPMVKPPNAWNESVLVNAKDIDAQCKLLRRVKIPQMSRWCACRLSCLTQSQATLPPEVEWHTFDISMGYKHKIHTKHPVKWASMSCGHTYIVAEIDGIEVCFAY